MKAPLLPLLIFYIVGSIAGYYLFIPFHITIAVFAALLVMISCAYFLRWRISSHLIIFFAFMALGIFRIHPFRYPDFPREHIVNFISEEKQVLEGILYRPPEYSWDRTRIYLNLIAIHERKKSYPVTGRLLLTVKDFQLQLDTGDRIRFLSRVNAPANFGNPGCFDYVGHLAREGIYATGFLPDTRYLARMGGKRDYLRMIDDARRTVRECFLNMGSPARGIALAMILGDKGEVSSTLRDEFVIAGVAHLLAISGLHVGIVAAVAYLVIRWLLRRSYHLTLLISVKKWASFLAIFPVLFYAVLSGWNLPTQRAVIMVITYLAAIILGRERDLMNTLCLAAFIILIPSPLSIFDISFQLSFVSVFFLICLAPAMSRLLPDEKCAPQLRYRWEIRVFRWLRESLSATVAATLGTLPFAALYFNRVSLIGIISNLILIPLLGFVTVPLGLSIAILTFISPGITLPFLTLNEQVIDGSLTLIRFLSHLPFSELRVSTPNLFEISLFYLSVFLLVNIRRNRAVKYCLACVLFLLMANLLFYQLRDRFNRNLRITFLDGGQGESALVEFPYGGKMLVDGGGFYNDDAIDVGERAIAPFLWKRKITKLDYVILTHPHPDHLNGLPFIARNFKPTFFWWNGEKALPPLSEKLHQVIGSVKGSSLAVNSTTPSLFVNGGRIDFLNPPPRSTWTGNNNSLAFRIVLGEVSFLMNGDIQKEAEEEIIRTGKYLRSTVIKVPHHGSLTSSSEGFIRAVQPKVAVFTGKLGRFLPHQKIIRRYEEMNAQTIRINQRGAVSFVTDGRMLWVKELKSGIMEAVVP